MTTDTTLCKRLDLDYDHDTYTGNEQKSGHGLAESDAGKLYRHALALEARIAKLEGHVKMLLLIIEHETGLPESAANGVTDPTSAIDEGVVKTAAVIDEAREALP